MFFAELMPDLETGAPRRILTGQCTTLIEVFASSALSVYGLLQAILNRPASPAAPVAVRWSHDRNDLPHVPGRGMGSGSRGRPLYRHGRRSARRVSPLLDQG